MGKVKCTQCQGTGKEIISEGACPDCKGIGSTKLILSSYSTKNDGSKCHTCSGTGVIGKSKKCSDCNGIGTQIICDSCGKGIKEVTVNEKEPIICQECKTTPMVFLLRLPCSTRTVNIGTYFEATVKEFKEFGVFAELAPGVDGLIRINNLKGIQRGDIGTKIIVFVCGKTREGKLELIPIKLKEYRHGVKRDPIERNMISAINRKWENRTILIQGKVSQIKKTSGPISYNFVDETGSIAGVAFIKPKEENPYQTISVGDIVEVVGIVNTHREMLQIEIQDMVEAGDEETKTIRDRIEKVLDKKSEPKEIPFLIKNDYLEKLKPELYKLAKLIRRAIFDGTPILLRHHADADGITCATALEQAILPIIAEEQPEAVEFRLKRSPSKSPFWDFIDVTKDIDFALQDAIKFGDKLPFVLLLDLGSTHESLASIKKAKLFGIDVAVVDHHFPETIVKDNVILHINPYYIEGDYNLCSGMLGVELARIINPNVSEKIEHLAAVAGLADRVAGTAIEQYLKVTKKKGLSEEFIKKIGVALDYEQFYLKFSDGKNIVDTIYGFDSLNTENHQKIVNFLNQEAQTLIDNQLAISLATLKQEELANHAILTMVDVEKFANKFDYPPPGKITGAVHDTICKKHSTKGVITFGLGPDFIVLRSKAVLINFPKIIENLKKNIPQAGADGGGHEVVGTVKYVEGMQNEVLSFVKEALGKAEIQIIPKEK